jgi:cyclophilin family peptidyl-prolyl cis-trans isomerase
MQLDREKASESVANFLRHVNSGFYNGLVFHRVKPNFMIQAGVLTADMQRRVSTVFPVANEADNGLENVRGAVAMARTSDPHSATSEFFINLIDNPGLDFREQTPQGWGYAVFGRVVEGMDVVDAVAAIPTTRRGRYADLPVEPTVIDSAYVANTP